ncbi:MAG: DMT family transporter [bacterium]|nr:DMT family transporter [bacterium]
MTTRTAEHLVVWPLIVFTGLVFGISGLLSKSLIDRGVDSFTVTAVPFLIGGGVAWLVAWRAGDIRWRALGAGAALGVINSSVPALLFNIGFETLSAGLVTLILSLGPVLTAALAHLVFEDERFTRMKGLGLVLAFAGVAALIAAPGVIEGASYRGAAWTFAGALLAGGSAILMRLYAVRHGALALIPPQLAVAGVTPIVAGIVFGRTLVPEGGFAGNDLLIMAVIGVGASYAGVRTLLLANQRGTTGQVAMVAYLIPLVGVGGGIIFLDERLTPWIVVGGGLILAGIALGGRASSAQEPQGVEGV